MSAAWIDLPWFGFDTETTGVHTGRDRIIQAAIVDSRGESHCWLINPGVPVSPAAQAVHGITTERLQNEGAEPRQALQQIAGVLVAAKRAGCPIVAFNGIFDIQMLTSDLIRNGLDGLANELVTDFHHLVDPLVLDRKLDRYRKGKRRLENVAEHYRVAPPDAYHDALADVEVTLGVLQAQVAAYPQLRETPLAELYAQQLEFNTQWVREMNEWLTKQGKEPIKQDHWELMLTRNEIE